MKKFLNPPFLDWKALQKRPTASYEQILPIVDEVFTAVQSEGDKAVRRYSNQFDNYYPDNIEIPKSAWEQAADELPQDLKTAIDKAYSNIYSFHKAQRTSRVEVSPQEGVLCWQENTSQQIGYYCCANSLCRIFVWRDTFVSGRWDTSHRRLDLWDRKHSASL
jgi:histidinol dehydrogenase